MPYIPQEQRDRLAHGDVARTVGEVNYLTSLLMHAYFQNYDDLNDIAEVIDDFIIELKTSDMISEQELEFGQELREIVMNAQVEPLAIRGALRNAYMEFYILRARPYEDVKIAEHGPL